MKVPLRWQFWSPENLKYSDGGALKGMLWGKMLHKIQVLRTCISKPPKITLFLTLFTPSSKGGDCTLAPFWSSDIIFIWSPQLKRDFACTLITFQKTSKVILAMCWTHRFQTLFWITYAFMCLNTIRYMIELINIVVSQTVLIKGILFSKCIWRACAPFCFCCV